MPTPHNTQINGVKWAAGSLATPTAAAYYRTVGMDFSIVEDRDFIAGAVSAGIAQDLPSRLGNRKSRGKFSVELAGCPGSPAAASPANFAHWGALMRACGFVETCVDATSLSYQLSDNTHLTGDGGPTDAIDLTFNVDGLQQKAINCVGDVSIVYEVNKIPRLDFDFTGNIDTGAAAAATSSLTETAIGSFTVGPAGLDWATATAGLNGVAGLSIDKCTVKVGNVITLPPNANSAYYGFDVPYIVRRKPSISLSVRIPALSSYNAEDLLAAGTSQALSISYTAGGSSFKTLTLTANIVLTGKYPARADMGGMQYWNLSAEHDGLTNLLKLAVT